MNLQFKKKVRKNLVLKITNPLGWTLKNFKKDNKNMKKNS